MATRIHVRDLQIGMFVSELDRPWLESPFLFQGFLVETQEELGELQALCDHVLVESEEERRAHGAAPVRFSSSSETRLPDKDRVGSFRESYRSLHSIHRRIERGLIKFLDDWRVGKLLDTRVVQHSVNELLDRIVANPDAAMWLTKLHTEDERTATHCLNVSIISLAFAHHLGLPRATMEAIGLGALLHDIGLSQRANDIIRKAGRLDEAEMSIVREHPHATIEFLDDPRRLPQVALDIVRWHHERIDGSGYPDGLFGAQIPQHALLVGLADAYDAMASDRAYRKARQPPEVLNELYRVADSQFGKELVESFIQSIGIYPVGSIVRLDTGALGVVAASDPGSRLEPLVLLLRDERGRRKQPYHLVDLARTARKTGRAWKIVEVVHPDEVGVNLAAVAADELRAMR